MLACWWRCSGALDGSVIAVSREELATLAERLAIINARFERMNARLVTLESQRELAVAA